MKQALVRYGGSAPTRVTVVLREWNKANRAEAILEARIRRVVDDQVVAVANHVTTFSIDGAPWNLTSLEYIDRLEEQDPRTRDRSPR